MTHVKGHHTKEAMRSRTNCTVAGGEVYSCALDSLSEARLVKDRGPKCTTVVVLAITLRAAARSISSALAASRPLLSIARGALRPLQLPVRGQV